jgi:hypothetical protein
LPSAKSEGVGGGTRLQSLFSHQSFLTVRHKNRPQESLFARERAGLSTN